MIPVYPHVPAANVSVNSMHIYCGGAQLSIAAATPYRAYAAVGA
jgi:hypothetical protein